MQRIKYILNVILIWLATAAIISYLVVSIILMMAMTNYWPFAIIWFLLVFYFFRYMYGNIQELRKEIKSKFNIDLYMNQ